jgi:hypothetical protein
MITLTLVVLCYFVVCGNAGEKIRIVHGDGPSPAPKYTVEKGDHERESGKSAETPIDRTTGSNERETQDPVKSPVSEGISTRGYILGTCLFAVIIWLLLRPNALGRFTPRR